MTVSGNESVGRTVERIGDFWQKSWFGPVSGFNFAVFRTGLGLLTFIWFVTLVPDLDAFFGEGSLALDSSLARGRLNIYRLFPPSDAVLLAGTGLGLIASVLLMTGTKTKIGGPLLAVLFASTMAENRLLWNAGDDLLQTLCLLFGLYCLLTPSSDLDISLARSWRTNAPLASGRIWLFQLVRIQMTMIYLVAFLTKIPGSTWRNGTATMTVFRLESLERFPTPAFLETNFLFANLITWSALALEGSLPFLLWRKRTRPYAIVAAVMFHLSIDWTLTIGLFSWIMVLGLTTFHHEDLPIKLRALRDRLSNGAQRLKRPAPGMNYSARSKAASTALIGDVKSTN